MLAQKLDTTTVAGLVSDATAAPSMHNAQPWRFRYAPSAATFTLLADPERTLPHADPTGRGLHVGCGAALLNLRVAIAHLGRRAVTTLLPAPGTPGLLATVRLDGPVPAADGLAALYPAIRDRHTSRYPFSDERVPQDVRAALVEAAAQEKAELTFPESPHLQSVLDLIRDAEGYNLMDDDRDTEMRHWARDTRGDAPVDGIPEYALGPRKRGGAAPARDFAGRKPVPGRPLVDFEERPQLALLSTAHDGPADWLRAGEALERVLLLATLHGLTSSFATQALEWPDLRWLLRDPLSGSGHVQMVLRLGYGPRGPATPRRSVKHVLTIDTRKRERR
ncbi:Acg family FMN-binding oxidoreductase [Streptomyces scopuliridis]|uniref:Acg family FMN-binding oxidoreductase n=1 Tax=Streptomyces scopuliridis TaxID=452529 RepID=UPI00369792CC